MESFILSLEDLLDGRLTIMASISIVILICFALLYPVAKRMVPKEKMRKLTMYITTSKRMFLLVFFMLFTISMGLMMLLKFQHAKGLDVPKFMGWYWNVIVTTSLIIGLITPPILHMLREFINPNLIKLFIQPLNDTSFTYESMKVMINNLISRGGQALILTSSMQQDKLADLLKEIPFDQVNTIDKYSPTDAPIVACTPLSLDKVQYFVPEAVFILEADQRTAKVIERHYPNAQKFYLSN